MAPHLSPAKTDSVAEAEAQTHKDDNAADSSIGTRRGSGMLLMPVKYHHKEDGTRRTVKVVKDSKQLYHERGG